MQQWIQHILSADQAGLAFFTAVFLLGMLGSVTSCCAFPVIGAVAGYAGSREAQKNRREFLLIGLSFMIGTTISLAAFGAIAGLVGQVVGSSLGRYWQFFAGIIVVLFGLLSLDLVHFRMPSTNLNQRLPGQGMFSAMIYGFALGGASTACSVGCNPLLPIAMSAAVLHGTVWMGAMTFAVFALGFSLPLAAGLIGISLSIGKLQTLSKIVMPIVRICAGILLVSVGFYLLATI